MEYEAIGSSIEIHGIQASRFGRSCEWHDTCGDTVCIDALVRVKWTQIEYGVNKRTTKAGVYWVTRGMDRCLIGFLPDKYLLHKDILNGRLAQIDEIYVGSKSRSKKRYSDRHEGVCYAVLVDAPRNGDQGINGHLFIVDSSSEED